MTGVAKPVLEAAMKERLQVAAIDFGTTYSGYAFSFRGDFKTNPLKILTNKWPAQKGVASMVSEKAPSCVLFTPEQEFHSFGYEAEDKYSKLAEDGETHTTWYFYKRFKMKLYENKDLRRIMQLPDETGKTMPALRVFSECIRYLKDHLMKHGEREKLRLKEEEIHWVLTVPAIWDDPAKQFMREAAVEAGIRSDHLSLALEPEAASLYCRHLPVDKVQGADGTTVIANFAPGKRYLVLDAGGGTVDITVHETQTDGTVTEVYKANGGPWGGTTIDAAFIKFLEDIAGRDVIEQFTKNCMEDYLDMFREFEVKKKSFEPSEMNADTKITLRVPVSLHSTYRELKGQDFRRSLMMKQSLVNQVTFTGDKIRVYPRQIHDMFQQTCDHIVSHLKNILGRADVQGTETILMVGGFSESRMLQTAIKDNFSDRRVIIPQEAGLVVLKGAVIFGHNPAAIISRRAKYTYGIDSYDTFDDKKHPESRKVIIDGKAYCKDCFSKHVEVNEEVLVGMMTKEKIYWPLRNDQTKITAGIYYTLDKNPQYVDGYTRLGGVTADVSGGQSKDDRSIAVQMIYGDTELGVKVRTVKTGEEIEGKFNFLG